MRSAPHAVIAALVCALAPGLCGCDDLNEFRTGDSSIFHGEVIGSGSESDEMSFIRQGFSSHTEMEVTFDPDLAAGSARVGEVAEGEQEVTPPVAGTIHTYQCPPETDRCDEAQRTPGHFAHAALEPIASLNHDALSQYDFPGAGRVRNYILGARFQSEGDDGAIARHAMVFVSLMENGSIEVRVVAPSILDAAGQQLVAPLFGVFVLQKRAL